MVIALVGRSSVARRSLVGRSSVARRSLVGQIDGVGA
jgi:hypothetical protein